METAGEGVKNPGINCLSFEPTIPRFLLSDIHNLEPQSKYITMKASKVQSSLFNTASSSSPSPSPSPSPSSSAAPHLLEKSQFIPELEHRLTDNTLLCVVFRLQAPEGHLSCLLVGLNKTIKCNIFFLKFGQIGWMARCLP